MPAGSTIPAEPAGTCTSSATGLSWLNLVDRWFKELTDRRLRRDTFTSLADLIDAIELSVEHWNDDNPKPFIWHRTAEAIIAIVRRGLDGARPSQIR